MSIFDKITSRKKKREKAHPQDKKQEREGVVAAPQKELKAPTGRSTIASLVLKKPRISEKAAGLAEQRWYTFEVSGGANKLQIKKAVEELYGVDVVSVRVLTVKGKTRRLGRIEGRTPDYKKALVKLSVGQELELLPK